MMMKQHQRLRGANHKLIIPLTIFIVLNATATTTVARTGPAGEGDRCTAACARDSDSCWGKCRAQPSHKSTDFPECMLNCTVNIPCEGCPISADCCSRCEVDFLSCGVVCDKGGFDVRETSRCLAGCKGVLMRSCIGRCGGCKDRFGDWSSACQTILDLCEMLRSRSVGFLDADLCSGCSPGYGEAHYS